jgi:hypothetical protein
MDASKNIDKYISDLGDWRGDILSRLRAIILDSDPSIVEEWKWKGVPVWSSRSVIAFGNGLNDRVKLGFLKGAQLPDPHHLFNAELEGNSRRAIEIREGDKLDEPALKALLKAAVKLNNSK